MQIFKIQYFEEKNTANCSNGQPKNSDNAVGGLVLPSHCTAPCLEQQRTLWHTLVVNKTYEKERDLFFYIPSVELSQKHVLAVCSPAPFFCMMIQFTVETHGPVLRRRLTVGGGEAAPRTDVFEGLPQPAELAEAELQQAAAPLLHPAVLVHAPSDGGLRRLVNGLWVSRHAGVRDVTQGAWRHSVFKEDVRFHGNPLASIRDAKGTEQQIKGSGTPQPYLLNDLGDLLHDERCLARGESASMFPRLWEKRALKVRVIRPSAAVKLLLVAHHHLAASRPEFTFTCALKRAE